MTVNPDYTGIFYNLFTPDGSVMTLNYFKQNIITFLSLDRQTKASQAQDSPHGLQN